MRPFAVLAAVALLASMSRADAAAPAALVVSGSGTRYVDVTLDRATTLHFTDLFYPGSLRASFTGDYAGVLILSADGKHVLEGVVVVRDWVINDAAREPMEVLLKDSQVLLKAGRYRLVLVTDGHAEVRLVATGLARTKQVVARTPYNGVTATRADIPSTAPAGPSAGTVSIPVTQPPGGMFTAAIYGASDSVAVSSQRICVRSPDAPPLSCLVTDPRPGGSDAAGGTNGTFTHSGSVGHSNVEFAPGHYVVDFTAAMVSAAAKPSSAFVLTLPIAY